MSRLILSAAVGAGAFIVLAGSAAAGYAIRQPREVTRTVVVTKTVPKTVTVTKWRTKTVTVTRTAAPAVPCVVSGGTPYPGNPGAGASTYNTTCTVTIQPAGSNASAGSELVLTDPSGTSAAYLLVHQ